MDNSSDLLPVLFWSLEGIGYYSYISIAFATYAGKWFQKFQMKLIDDKIVSSPHRIFRIFFTETTLSGKHDLRLQSLS